MPLTTYVVAKGTHPVIFLKQENPILETTNVAEALTYATLSQAQTVANQVNITQSTTVWGARPKP